MADGGIFPDSLCRFLVYVETVQTVFQRGRRRTSLCRYRTGSVCFLTKKQQRNERYRVAFREGYPEVGLYYEKAAYEEAEHAAKFAELLGEVVTDSTKKNLQMRVEAENGATAGKTDLAKRAKALNLDAIHDTVHEMARDEARHGKAFAGLLARYFGK